VNAAVLRALVQAANALSQAATAALEDLDETRSPGGLVDIAAAVPGPKRTLYAACRRGELPGAARVGRRWLAPRASIDSWLRGKGPRLVEAPKNDGDGLEHVRLRLMAGGRRRSAR